MIFFIETKNWLRFLGQISNTYRIYAPFEVFSNLTYQIVTHDNAEAIVIGTHRATQPVKMFFSLPQENVTDSPFEVQRTVVVGVKNCDLKAIQILDKVFLEGEFVDPFYKEKREKTLIISADCYEPRDTCFCSLLDSNPFPEGGYDLNLCLLDEGFLLEIGSARGEAFIRSVREDLRDASGELLEERDAKRKKAKERVSEVNREFKTGRPYTSIVKNGFKSPVWEEVAKTCVECAGCTNVCPSCFCFLLVDVEDKGMFPRAKFWDSCQHTGFARVAAGINPRAKLFERLRNRYLCKYEYRPENFGIVACTGCGRCIETCQGKIDKRDVLKKLENWLAMPYR